MGYKYQNKLDEENERRYWQQFPPWRRKLTKIFGKVFFVLFMLLGAYGTFGWVILHFL